MLDTAELRLLSKWCRARNLHWQPGVDDDGRPALLLMGAPQQTMMLLVEDEEWCLMDQPGDVLAAASGLAELLDALDAGMGAPGNAAPLELVLAGPLGEEWLEDQRFGEVRFGMPTAARTPVRLPA